MIPPLDERCASWLSSRIADADLARWARELLLDLCSIDTTIRSALADLRASEQECFDRLLDALEPHLPECATVRRLHINPGIAHDARYTVPYYAGTSRDDPAAVYADRTNLLIDAAAGRPGPRWVLNAHVDTVPPHIAPAKRGDDVAGRGAADDKGGVVAAAVTVRLLEEWSKVIHREVAPVQILISIDEEMGGNGTLGAVDFLELADAHVVVLEPTELRPYPANRGAVWFEIDVAATHDRAEPYLFGAFRSVASALASAAQQLRSESRHPLFTAADVSFCLGVLGPFGDHPASACDCVELTWPVPVDTVVDPDAVASAFAAGLADAEAVVHTAADPTVAVRTEDGCEDLVVTIHALPGHMGSHDRDTDAITKAAVVIATAEGLGMGLPRWPGDRGVIRVAGGQGFLPDRGITDVVAVLSSAFEEGLAEARRRYGLEVDDLAGKISFDRLHNNAFASASAAPAGPTLAAAVGSICATDPPPVVGWKASCDARIFADHCDDVVTFGAGTLEVAHGPNEWIAVQDVLRAAATVALSIASFQPVES